jgi:hypothetical protein
VTEETSGKILLWQLGKVFTLIFGSISYWMGDQSLGTWFLLLSIVAGIEEAIQRTKARS